jgi:type III secretion system low calcium response chaperone LcrH/SycD
MAKAADAEIDEAGLELIVNAITSEGYAYRDFTSISDEELEAAYAQAYQLLNQERHDEAEKLFEMLCQLDHYQARFWIGLGACRQMRKGYEPATKAYAMAGSLDVENPIPALRAAECFLALGNLEAAESGLLAARHWAGAKPEFEGVRQRAIALTEALDRRKGASQ